MLNGICHPGGWGSLGSLGPLGWTGLILGALLWAGTIVGLALLVLRAGRRSMSPAGPAGPKAALQAQYARGEITREVYESRKQQPDEPVE